jgi:hypothetical protein
MSIFQSAIRKISRVHDLSLREAEEEVASFQKVRLYLDVLTDERRHLSSCSNQEVAETSAAGMLLDKMGERTTSTISSPNFK